MNAPVSVLAIDPGASYLGVALVRRGTPHVLVGASRVIMGGADQVWDRATGRLVEVVRDLAGPPPSERTYSANLPVLVVEHNAFTPREDVGPRNAGQVGWTQGYVVGLVSAALSSAHLVAPGDPRLVSPGEWRKTMEVYSARQGKVLQPPNRRAVTIERETRELRLPRPPGRVVDHVENLQKGMFRVHYRCGHLQDITGGLPALQAASLQCATCEAARKEREKPKTMGEILSEEWKATACSFVFAHWPDTFRRLLAECKRNVQDTSPRPAHQYPGMADACEAVAIAVHGLETSA